MLIADAIRTSQSEAAVHFLLTAYLDNLSRSESSSRLPTPVTRLPLAGDDDVRDRMLALVTQLLAPTENLDEVDNEVLTDALRVFGAAVYRLTVLDSNEVRAHECAKSARPALSSPR